MSFFCLVNTGHSTRLAIQPAATTYSQLSNEQQIARGITPGLIRLSSGIEHIDDILEDLANALN